MTSPAAATAARGSDHAGTAAGDAPPSRGTGRAPRRAAPEASMAAGEDAPS